MAKLPRDLSGAQLRKALERAGFVLTRQKGSHMILRRTHPAARVVVPNHAQIRVGTLRDILNDVGLTIEQLRDLM